MSNSKENMSFLSRHSSLREDQPSMRQQFRRASVGFGLQRQL